MCVCVFARAQELVFLYNNRLGDYFADGVHVLDALCLGFVFFSMILKVGRSMVGTVLGWSVGRWGPDGWWTDVGAVVGLVCGRSGLKHDTEHVGQ